MEAETKERKRPVFIASAPNAQKDDREIARKLLFASNTWFGGKQRAEVTSRFAKMHEVGEAFAFDSGRAALAAILQSIPIKSGDEVITQAFTCLAVPLGIQWAGGTPVYADITNKGFNPTPEQFASEFTDKTRAIIVQHTFGEPAAIDGIKAIIEEENLSRSKDRQIILIEDCAHALGVSYKGQQIGTWGDASFFSFGQDKVLSCTRGGLALSKDTNISNSLKKIHDSAPEQHHTAVRRAIIHPLLWNIINTTYYFPPFLGKATLGRLLILMLKSLGIIEHQADPKKVSTTPTIHKLSDAHATMLLNQITKLDRYLKHRAQIAHIYNERLPQKHRIQAKNHGYLRFPIRSTEITSLTKKLKSNRVIPGNWYSSPIHPKGTELSAFNYKPGSCPNAEKASEETLNLPTSPNVSETDAKRIASILT